MQKLLRAIVVDDSQDDALLLVRELRRTGYRVEYAWVDTENQLRQTIQQAPWDVVLSDYAIPGFGGLEALRVTNEYKLPFIMVSGSFGEELAVEVLQAGADDYLLKGRLGRLSASIERALRAREERLARSQAEEALRQSEARFRGLVESLGESVFTLDLALRVDGKYGRSEGARILGQTARESFGADAAPHEEAAQRALAGERVIYEWSQASPNGFRHYQTSVSPRWDASHRVTGVVGLDRDITPQKQLQVQLATADRMVSVGLLASGVAHELNNPLTAIIANLELALSAELDEAARQEELCEAHEAALRIAKIVKDLRMFSRPNDETPSALSLQRALETSLRMADHHLRHRARVVRDYRPIPLVVGNDSKLGQVFLNLIINAAQALPEGRADQHEVRVVTRTDEQGRAVVEIQDTGAGMSEETQAKLFTPFFTTKPPGLGTGLGLSISQRIVTSFGGTIEVESAPNRGSVFRLRFPAAPPSAPQGEPGPPPAPAPVLAWRPRLLLIDDDPLVLRTLERGLSAHYQLTALPDARYALDRIAAGETADLVLCDLMMPGMTGLEFQTALTKLNPGLAERLLFLTGSADHAHASPSQTPIIEKPVELSQLRRLLAERLSASPPDAR